MRKLSAVLIALACVGAIAGCTTNNTVGGPAFTTHAKLTMSVGTFNDPHGELGPAGTFQNIVTAFRNQLGNSAFISPGTASMTGPSGAIVLPAGNGALPCNELFVYGQAISCNGLVGMAPAYPPPDSINPLYQYPTGFISLSFVPLAPTPGQYSATTTAMANGHNLAYSATATMPSPFTVLGAPGGVTGFTSDGKGGGTFTVAAAPSGVTEQIVEVASGNAQVASALVSGTTATITGTGNCAGTPPVGSPIPCGSFVVIVVGADYLFVEAGPPASKTNNPTLTGANGTSDLSVSTLSALNE